MNSTENGVSKSYASASGTKTKATSNTVTRDEIIKGVQQRQWELDNPMPYNYYQKVLAHRKNHIFVGKFGKSICALYAFRFTGRTLNDATIALIWTHQKHRKKGYLTRLMYAASLFLVDNSYTSSDHSTSVHSQQFFRNQNWNEVSLGMSFAIETKKLRQTIMKKCRQKNIGLHYDDWEITLDSSDTDGILAVYTLAQNEATNDTGRNRNNFIPTTSSTAASGAGTEDAGLPFSFSRPSDDTPTDRIGDSLTSEHSSELSVQTPSPSGPNNNNNNNNNKDNNHNNNNNNNSNTNNNNNNNNNNNDDHNLDSSHDTSLSASIYTAATTGSHGSFPSTATSQNTDNEGSSSPINNRQDENPNPNKNENENTLPSTTTAMNTTTRSIPTNYSLPPPSFRLGTHNIGSSAVLEGDTDSMLSLKTNAETTASGNNTNNTNNNNNNNTKRLATINDIGTCSNGHKENSENSTSFNAENVRRSVLANRKVQQDKNKKTQTPTNETSFEGRNTNTNTNDCIDNTKKQTNQISFEGRSRNENDNDHNCYHKKEEEQKKLFPFEERRRSETNTNENDRTDDDPNNRKSTKPSPPLLHHHYDYHC